MEFRTAYGPHKRYPTIIEGESRAKQSMKDECDINGIVERYARSGLVTHLAKGQPRYLDVSEMTDYRAALDQVERVGEFFAGLPAKLRSRFHNDPAAFLDFMSDPENVEEIRDLGLDEAPVQESESDPEPEPTSDDE